MSKTLYFLYDGETISNPRFMDIDELVEAEEQLCADGAASVYRYVPAWEAVDLLHGNVFKECQE